MQQVLVESNLLGSDVDVGELESPSVPENLIRLSVGCENSADLWNDIDIALTKA